MKLMVWVGAFSLVIGILILTGYFVYYLIWLTFAEAGTLIKIAVPALFLGILILLSAVIVERFRTRKKESSDVREVKY